MDDVSAAGANHTESLRWWETKKEQKGGRLTSIKQACLTQLLIASRSLDAAYLILGDIHRDC